MNNKYFHSVELDAELCCGCTNCLKRCPTEAIRIRNGKAHILSERCIDCGECIRICPHHAKRARSNSIDEIKPYKVKVAIPAPALFGQFNNLNDIDIVLTGLRAMGFDMIYEVSRAAELVSEATRQLIRENALKKPIISSACPAVVRLIKIRFPELCDNVMPLLAPMEVAAKMARREVIAMTGLPDEEIGVFFITPCPAKVTEINNPTNSEKSAVTGAIAISQIYPELTSKMDKLSVIEPIAKSGLIGVGWATSGGEAAAMLGDKYLAADGIENVIRVLEELEDEHIHGVDFIELNACSGGCVGGVLAVENPYVAQARIQNLRKYLPVSLNHLEENDMDKMKWENELTFNAESFRLSDDIVEAIDMMEKMEEICKDLPGLDCGSCGAPTCRALAEDIVKGNAKETDCIHKLKAKIQNVYDQLGNL
ncbi:[Fe-Fe] hydrogenase large subunit C-terminal domain-containing protein [Ruminococcus sp.]|uniref:[Fe-Fe] hydrogenase large subunit C-terminal domain-containing protein n=1 Tax=Ruminococcus sp. TaxID=41978 RepID=UPI00292D9890|nr:[Fe-Fe] hydrogenase large subunit C-terminal domain-containing protein [uncultured Ruminococcus sp.]MBQ1473969.1 4Fe-4S dicluster domain-containing protein [Ruminococcus sp.]